MKIKIQKKYLIFPVNTFLPRKKLMFKIDGETVYSLNIKLDNYTPDFFSYIDVSRFMNKEIELYANPETEINFKESDTMEIENLYNEPLRPQVHFSTKNGWINDPNGLIYLNGVYHMFYQYNPAEPEWENMHWGHAQSRDLVHWEEKDTALFPDSRGTMFSGSAFLDEKNVLGLKDGKNNAALLFYTATEPFCQYMSYSTDDFKTIAHYGKQPVVPHILDCNRDPKVVFCDELNCYIMALYLGEDIYCLLKSENLTDWSELQRIRLNGDDECPDIFKVKCDNGEYKWVLMGAHDKYLVGNFENGKFEAEQSELSFHYGTSAYAGQSVSNMPNGRVVRIEWDRWNLRANGFKGQMGFPMELSLKKYDGIYYLESAPIEEINNICKNKRSYNVITNSENDFVEKLDDYAQLLKLKSEFYKEGILELEIFGITITFDFAKNELKMGNNTAPVSLTCESLDVTIILDRCSIELFSDGGKIFVSHLNSDTVYDRNIPYLKMSSDKNMNIETEINSLESIWRQ